MQRQRHRAPLIISDSGGSWRKIDLVKTASAATGDGWNRTTLLPKGGMLPCKSNYLKIVFSKPDADSAVELSDIKINHGLLTLEDFLNDWTQVHAKTDNCTLDTSGRFQYFDGDGSRFSRSDNEPGSIVYKFNNIRNFDARVFFYGADGILNFYTSADGQDWTQADVKNTKPMVSGSGWIRTAISPAGRLPAGANYLKLEASHPAWNWAVQVSQVAVTYGAKGDNDAVIDGPFEDVESPDEGSNPGDFKGPVLEDNLDDWSKVYDRTYYWNLDRSNADAYFEGDTSRAARTQAADEYLIYKFDGLKDFSIRVYRYYIYGDLKIYASGDNVSWTELEVQAADIKELDGYWIRAYIKPAALIPEGTNYLKIVASCADIGWTPQISQVVLYRDELPEDAAAE